MTGLGPGRRTLRGIAGQRWRVCGRWAQFDVGSGLRPTIAWVELVGADNCQVVDGTLHLDEARTRDVPRRDRDSVERRTDHFAELFADAPVRGKEESEEGPAGD